METLHAYKRLTRKYVGTCKHMDEEKFVGTIKLTPPRVIREGNGYDQGPTLVRWARLPVRCNKQEMLRAIEDTMSAHGCTHEYDCCGCASYYTRAHIVKGRRIRVATSISYNY